MMIGLEQQSGQAAPDIVPDCGGRRGQIGEGTRGQGQRVKGRKGEVRMTRSVGLKEWRERSG